MRPVPLFKFPANFIIHETLTLQQFLPFTKKGLEHLTVQQEIILKWTDSTIITWDFKSISITRKKSTSISVDWDKYNIYIYIYILFVCMKVSVVTMQAKTINDRQPFYITPNNPIGQNWKYGIGLTNFKHIQICIVSLEKKRKTDRTAGLEATKDAIWIMIISIMFTYLITIRWRTI